MESSKMSKSQSKYYNSACLMNEALILLLDKKDYPFITVKEICQKAGVNRSTFYLHYETMEDLLNETIEYMGKKVMDNYSNEQVIQKEKISTCSLDELILISPKYLIPYLQFIKDNKKFYKVAYSQPKLLKAQDISSYLYKSFFLPILVRFNVPEKERKYRISFSLNGISAVIMDWVKGDCKESVEEMTEILIKCLNIGEDLWKNGNKD